jgi:nitroimidazol reductase NimA-like FMN-containing flavoprotein (pyridoxamine 5'-phosphate oxidase superfamily)
MDRLLPAKTAMGFSMEYESVIVFGSAMLVTDPDEAQRGLQLLLDKYFPHLKPGEDYRQIIPEELNVTTVYRLDIEQWSGKANRAEGDHPGAFFYEDLPGEKKRAP